MDSPQANLGVMHVAPSSLKSYASIDDSPSLFSRCFERCSVNILTTCLDTSQCLSYLQLVPSFIFQAFSNALARQR